MIRTAQDAYAEVIAAVHVALKRRGFLKRGHRFGLRRGDDWAIIDLQKHSLASTRENIRFTINVGVWFRDLEDATRVAPPSIVECHWWDRAGHEPFEKGEHWWIIDNETVSAVLARRLVGAIVAALPNLERHLDEVAVLTMFMSGDRSAFRIGRSYESRVQSVLNQRALSGHAQ